MRSTGVPTYHPTQPKIPAQPPVPAPPSPGEVASQTPISAGISNPVAPPETLQGADLRIGARESYGLNLADINRRLLQAALDYGGVDSIQQGGWVQQPDGTWVDTSTTANVTANPNSRLAQLQRSLDQNTTSINEDLNNRGSFFSGAHLDQQQKLVDEVNRQRTQAKADYDAAVADLLSQLAQARSSREGLFRQANEQDIAAQLAKDPEAQAQNPPAVPTPTVGSTPIPASGGFNPFGPSWAQPFNRARSRTSRSRRR